MNFKKVVSGHLFFVLLLAIGASCPVLATPVFLHEELNKLDISVESSLVGLRGMVFIENKEPETVACQVVFKNGPELPITRKERIKPGVKKVVSANMSRAIIRLNIDVTCKKE